MYDPFSLARLVLVCATFLALLGAAHVPLLEVLVPQPQDGAPLAIAEDAIGGVIRDAKGAPLAGVAVGLRRLKVAVAPRQQRSGGPLFDGEYGVGAGETLGDQLDRVRAEWRPSLDEALAAAEEAWHARRSEVLTTTTDANGVFVFEGLAEPGAYGLDHSLAGYSFDWHSSSAAQRGQRLEIVARKMHPIEFEFVGDCGEVFDEVLVRKRYGSSTTGVYWERAQPTLEFTSEPVTLQFAAGGRFMRGYEPLGEYTSETIAIDPGDPALGDGPLRVVLRRRVWLTVQLEDPWSAGGGSGERWLVAKMLADGEVFDATAWAAQIVAARPLHGVEGATTPNLRFARDATYAPRVVFDDLERGRYVVGVCDEAAKLLGWSEVALEQPGTVVTVRPTPPSLDGRLVVRLVNAHGNRLSAPPRFVVDARLDGKWYAIETDVLSAPNGEHWLGLERVPERASELRVGAIHETLGLVYADIAPDVRELELAFPLSATLELSVVGIDPALLPTSLGAQLTYVGPQLTSFGRRRSNSHHLVLGGFVRPSFGPDDTATIGGLPPGVWRVEITYSLHGVRTVVVDGDEVVLEPGATLEHVVSATKLVEVVVETAASYAGQPLALLAPDSDREISRAVVDEDGVARFTLIPVGPARLGLIKGTAVDQESLTDVVIDGSRIEWRKQ